MAGKLQNASLLCNLLLFALEVVVLLIFFNTLSLKDSKDTEKMERIPAYRKVLLARSKRSFARAEIPEESESLTRSSRPVRTQPRTSTTCRTIYDYWASACLPQNEHPDTSITRAKEKSFLQAFLDYLYAYLRKLESKSSTEQDNVILHDIPTEESTRDREAMPIRGSAFASNVEASSRPWRSNQTSAEKCRRIGMEGSLACMFEYEHPQIALKLYRTLRPFLLAKDVSLSNREILRESQRRQSAILLPADEPHGERRKRSADLKNPVASYLRLNRRLKKRKRKRRELAQASDLEVCSTQYSNSNLISAVHATTGTRVSLYVFRGGNQSLQIHMQLFEVGTCRSASPVSNVVISSTLRPICKETQSKILAYIMVKSAQVTSGQYNICRGIPGTSYAVCRDWIFVSSQCKLYLV